MFEMKRLGCVCVRCKGHRTWPDSYTETFCHITLRSTSESFLTWVAYQYLAAAARDGTRGPMRQTVTELPMTECAHGCAGVAHFSYAAVAQALFDSL